MSQHPHTLTCEGCEEARNSQDDITILVSNLNQLEIRTEQVLNKIRKSHLKLDQDKRVFGATEPIFLGHKISGKMTSPNPENVKITKDIPFPRSKQYLRRFLGIISFLSKLIPQLFEQTLQLTELVIKDSIWDFSVTHRYQFDKLRSTVS